ncbi:MAG: protein kinase [Oscillospiraceae bacterium]|nr:protein kinase [Oscillospiraceae bacterium]
MIENFNRCLGCMKTIGDASVCPKCGYIKGSPVASPHLPPGTILTERYLLGKVSSSNGEGAVYISFDTKIETAVDIKEYAPETLCERAFRSSELRVLPGCEPKYKALMYDFIELYRQLAHMRTLQNIQKVFHVFEQNNTVYVVMEHISGVTLKQYISDRMGELTVPDALRLFEPVFPVLSTLHRADIIHRGISPDTILVTKNEEIKLCGFAISPVRASGSELSPMLYRGYAAPEQYSPNSSHAPYTDVYSLAAVMYKTITGTMPPEATGR